MWLETNRLIIRSIQRGDEIIFSGMSQDGSLSQVGFDANCSEWINDWIEEALKLTNNDNPRENYIPCTVILNGLSTLFQTNFFRLFFRYCTGV